MVAGKLRALADSLYSVHSDLMSMSITGKDAQRFCGTLDRIGALQQQLRQAAAELDSKEKEGENVGDS